MSTKEKKYYLIVYQSGETLMTEVQHVETVGGTGATVFFGNIKDGSKLVTTEGKLGDSMEVISEFSMRTLVFHRRLTGDEAKLFREKGTVPDLVKARIAIDGSHQKSELRKHKQ